METAQKLALLRIIITTVRYRIVSFASKARHNVICSGGIIILACLIAENIIRSNAVASHMKQKTRFTRIVPVDFPNEDRIKFSSVEQKEKLEAAESHDYIDQIRKPLHDRRSYRYFKLRNQMKVLLISDPDCDEAAASIRVGVGSAADPEEVPGLAHMLEHMLFQGSTKFPENTEFFDFINKHGGYSNAFTARSSTIFSFSLTPDVLNPGLQRMADLIANPLLNSKDMHKEVNAVHSEFLLDVNDDSHRANHLIRQTIKGGPFSHFSVGNKESLVNNLKQQNIDLQAELRKFHDTWYSANLMTLAVIGKESLKILETVVRSHFEPIKNKEKLSPAFEECSESFQPLDESELQTEVFVTPEADIHEAAFVFYLPPQFRNWKAKPLQYIAGILGHEGKNLLASKLKAENLASSLQASYWSPEICTVFQVTVELTQKGRSLESLHRIGILLFLFIRALTLTPPEPWRYEEQRELRFIEFFFGDAPDPFELSLKAVDGLHFYPPREILAGDRLLYEHDPDLVLRYIKQFLSPQNVRLFIFDKRLAGNADRMERWYRIKHRVRKIHMDIADSWLNIFEHEPSMVAKAMKEQGLQLPGHNPFVPTTITLAKGLADTSTWPKYPKRLVFSTAGACFRKCNVYHKQDNLFETPRILLELHIYYTERLADPALEYLLTTLYLESVDLALRERFYDARLAGLSFSLRPGVSLGSAKQPIVRREKALTLTLFGYSNTLPLLLELLTQVMVGMSASVAQISATLPEFAKSISVDGLQLESEHTLPPNENGTQASLFERQNLSLAFDRLKTQLAAATFHRTPLKQASEAMLELLLHPFTPLHKLHARLLRLEKEKNIHGSLIDQLFFDILLWSKKMWNSAYVEGLVQGNITNSAAIKLVENILFALPLKKLISEEEVEFANLKSINTLLPEKLPEVSSTLTPAAAEKNSTDIYCFQGQKQVCAEGIEDGLTIPTNSEHIHSASTQWFAAASGRDSTLTVLDSMPSRHWGEAIPTTADISDTRTTLNFGSAITHEADGQKIFRFHRFLKYLRTNPHVRPVGGSSGHGFLRKSHSANDKSPAANFNFSAQTEQRVRADGFRMPSGLCFPRRTLYGEEDPAQAAPYDDNTVATAANSSRFKNDVARIFFVRPNMNVADRKSQSHLVVEVGPLGSMREKALLYLVDRWMAQEFFNRLRTKEQLGYVTSMHILRVEDKYFYTFTVTTACDPYLVGCRISHFLATERARPMHVQEFTEFQQAAISVWKQKPKNVQQEFRKNIREIVLGDKVFDFNERMVTALRQLTLSDVLTFKEYALYRTPWLHINIVSQNK